MTKLEKLELEIEILKTENNLLTGWISLISHDSKQIFGNIKWLIEAYEDDTISKDDFFKMLPQIKKDATKNFSVAQSTGEWLKTQFGNFSPNADVLNGFNFYDEIKEENENKFLSKELSFDFEGDYELNIITDKVLLLFIVNKLVDNAIKYSHKKNKILFTAEEDHTNYILSITDYGIGMTESNVDSVFSFESPVYEGTTGEIGAGLSLKIVQSFVFLLGGHIVIKSVKDQGTTISICLPKSINKKKHAK